MAARSPQSEWNLFSPARQVSAHPEVSTPRGCVSAAGAHRSAACVDRTAASEARSRVCADRAAPCARASRSIRTYFHCIETHVHCIRTCVHGVRSHVSGDARADRRHGSTPHATRGRARRLRHGIRGSQAPHRSTGANTHRHGHPGPSSFARPSRSPAAVTIRTGTLIFAITCGRVLDRRHGQS
jgi:hypothetical protein